MSKGINKLYEFGDFRLDAENKTLWRNEEIISLSPKSLDVLQLLAEAEGKLV